MQPPGLFPPPPLAMPDLPATRQSLLLELGRRSDAAWVEFLGVYEQAIYRVCRAKGLQDADARDVTQDVLAAVHARVADWDHDAAGSFRGWLMRVARNLSVDAIAQRARGAQGLGESGVERLLDAQPSRESETAFELELRRASFEWAARKVREEVRPVTWRAFEGTALEGRSASEVAAELEVSVGNVHTAKCRVVARIRERVGQLDADAAPR